MTARRETDEALFTDGGPGRLVLEQFELFYGPLADCEGFIERKHYLDMLGVFTMGWEACQRLGPRREEG